MNNGDCDAGTMFDDHGPATGAVSKGLSVVLLCSDKIPSVNNFSAI